MDMRIESVGIQVSKAFPEVAQDILVGAGDLLKGVDPVFQRALEDQQTRDATIAVLTNHLVTLQDITGKQIRRILMSLNDYTSSLGIGLASVEIEARDEVDDEVILRPDEKKSPTLGVAPIKNAGNRILAGFGVEDGGEELQILSAEFKARGFLGLRGRDGGERMRPHKHVPPVERGEILFVPLGNRIGVNVGILNIEKLRASGLEHTGLWEGGYPVDKDGVYFCRYLTREAVLKKLGFSS